MRHLLYAIATFAALWPASPKADEIPLGIDSGVYTIPVEINGAIKIPFTLDSGASVVVIPDDVARTLIRSGTVTPSDVIGTSTARLADGSTMKGLRLRLRQLRIGSRTVHDVLASVSPGGGDPLLGQSVLMRFGSVTIDNQRRVLVLSDGLYVPPATASVAPSSVPGTAVVGVAGAGGFGALAYEPSNGRFGLSSNNVNQSAADYAAIRDCGSTTCKIVFRTMRGQCGAIAIGDSGKAWGAGKELNRAAAEVDAINNCQKHTASQCRVRAAGCN